MTFVSWAFALLFALVMLARVTIGRRHNEPPFLGVLLAASLVFYAWHIPIYLLVLVASSTVDYVAARAIHAAPAGAPARRRWLVLSLVANLGLLAAFKYGDFAIRATEDLAGLGGWSLRLPDLGLVLPMGISFYTFQALSYTIDVYRGLLVPIRHYGRYLLFITFFPQLVAGPIVRATEFLPQMPKPRQLSRQAFYQGAWLLVLGFFLKMVCADNLAAFVDAHWARAMQPGADATFTLSLAVMFSGQIFADFCGYSTIAQGLGYWLGYRFPDNFNAPYIAATFKNFWERWHITLSRWLRDYLYVPLGGNRGSRTRTMVNLLVVMLLGGLWHGAAYTFIVWGGLHGACLAIERLLGLHRPATRPWLVTAAWAVVVQALVLVAWVFFRSPTIDGAWMFLTNIATGAWEPPDGTLFGAAAFLVPLVLLHAWTWAAEQAPAFTLAPATRAMIAAAMAYAILTAHGGTSAFIYFQF
ncbi:MAG: MBOAT family O-acyltransferase [Vicinamibacterales bacterium]